MENKALLDKLTSIGYRQLLKKSDVLVYMNTKISSCTIIKNGEIAEKVTGSKYINIYGTDDITHKDKEVKDKYHILELLDSNTDLVAKLAIDSSGTIVKQSTNELAYSTFFFYEDDEVWLVSNGGKLLMYNKISKNKYCHDFKNINWAKLLIGEYISIINEKTIIVAGLYVDFKTHFTLDVGECGLFKYGEYIVEVSPDNDILHLIDTTNGTLYKVKKQARDEKGIKVVMEKKNGTGGDNGSKFTVCYIPTYKLTSKNFIAEMTL